MSVEQKQKPCLALRCLPSQGSQQAASGLLLSSVSTPHPGKAVLQWKGQTAKEAQIHVASALVVGISKERPSPRVLINSAQHYLHLKKNHK